ncbi:biotin/lipoyl-containing protein [Sphingopyxis sp. J-6]|uniref:acetyl-CoA carboxylase biotin carboxyl carrier protein n=1 Tax=Sphingopyxis sp. J-6 TaxID=3122054 RepID=UPI00398410F8
MSGISTQDIEALMALFERTEWKAMHLTLGDFDLFLSKDGSSPDRAVAPFAHALPVASAPVPPADAPAPATPSSGRADAPVVPAGWTLVTATSLGTFYRAPKPGAPVFTELGASVAEDSELCLIEVMKLFTTLRATTTGTVREIYAEDGQLVEFGQPLFLIEPHG